MHHLDVLLDPELGAIVDMVLWSPERGRVRGRVVRRQHPVPPRRHALRGGRGRGRDPFADQSPDRFAGLTAELADPFPDRAHNSYPFAFEQTAQLFDHPAAPDLCVVHSAAHNWEDQGGHIGEHGSLGVLQARAPFVIAGKGVRDDGLVDAGAASSTSRPRWPRSSAVDPHATAYLDGQDGAVRADVLDPRRRTRRATSSASCSTARNPNVLYALARARRRTERRPSDRDGHGVRVGCDVGDARRSRSRTTRRSSPAAIPGHHGILHNAWWDRARGEQVITNSQATWPWSMQHLFDGVETLHHAVHRTWPDACTASVNEPCDVGADYSTFDFFRRGDVSADPRHARRAAARHRAVRAPVEGLLVVQRRRPHGRRAGGRRSGAASTATQSYPHPRFMWCNFTLTDSAFHAGGPHSEIAAASVRDTDARIGEVLDAVERAGVFDDTAFVLVADHGMQETDPAVHGRLGRRVARRRASRSATRATASCTSASE